MNAKKNTVERLIQSEGNRLPFQQISIVRGRKMEGRGAVMSPNCINVPVGYYTFHKRL